MHNSRRRTRLARPTSTLPSSRVAGKSSIKQEEDRVTEKRFSCAGRVTRSPRVSRTRDLDYGRRCRCRGLRITAASRATSGLNKTENQPGTIPIKSSGPQLLFDFQVQRLQPSATPRLLLSPTIEYTAHQSFFQFDMIAPNAFQCKD